MVHSELTMGSLFDGIGGFPLAAQRCGIHLMWDKSAGSMKPAPLLII